MKTFLSIILIITFAVQDDFTFVNNKEKIILKIDDGKKNLTWNNKSVLTLELKNIKKETVMVVGTEIEFVRNSNPNKINLEVTPNKELFESDKMELDVSYFDSKHKYVSHTFLLVIE